MPNWYDITRNPDYQSLSEADRLDVKRTFFNETIGKNPEFHSLDENGKQATWMEFMQSPDDTGQGQFTSTLGAVGRGLGEVVPGAIQGLGALTGIEPLERAGESVRGGLESISPVNPLYEDTVLSKGAGVVGQIGSVLATAGIGGAVGKGLAAQRIAAAAEPALAASQAIARGANLASYGSAALQGAASGAQTADQYGLTGAERYGNILAGAAGEVGSEMLPFGLGAETALAKRILTKAPQAGGLLGDVATESLEEGANQLWQNAALQALAPAGTKTPGLGEGVLEAMGYGALGGGLLGGVNVAAGAYRKVPQAAQNQLESSVEGVINNADVAPLTAQVLANESPDTTPAGSPVPGATETEEILPGIGAINRADIAGISEAEPPVANEPPSPESLARDAGEVTPTTEESSLVAPEDEAVVTAMVTPQPQTTQTNALQKQSTGSVLQREQKEARKTGSERERVEPSLEGQEAAGTRQEGEVKFKTAKGSEYVLFPDGTTVRNKAERPEHPGEKGIMPQSSKTIFVTKKGADALGIVQTEGIGFELKQRPDKTWGAVATDGPAKGKFYGTSITQASEFPEVGLIPVEIWNRKGKKQAVHFGNEITEITPQGKPTTATVGKVTPGGSAVERDATKPAQMTPEEFEKVKNSLNLKRDIAQSKLADAEAIQPSKNPAVQIKQIDKLRARKQELDDAERAFEEFYPTMAFAVEDAIKNRQPFSTYAHKEIGMDYIPSGYVKQGDLYVFQPETAAKAPNITAVEVIPEDYARAQANAKKGGPEWKRVKANKQPIEAYRKPDGQLKMYGGHHRLVNAQQKGKKTIPVSIDGEGVVDVPLSAFQVEQTQEKGLLHAEKLADSLQEGDVVEVSDGTDTARYKVVVEDNTRSLRQIDQNDDVMKLKGRKDLANPVRQGQFGQLESNPNSKDALQIIARGRIIRAGTEVKPKREVGETDSSGAPKLNPNAPDLEKQLLSRARHMALGMTWDAQKGQNGDWTHPSGKNALELSEVNQPSSDQVNAIFNDLVNEYGRPDLKKKVSQTTAAEKKPSGIAPPAIIPKAEGGFSKEPLATEERKQAVIGYAKALLGQFPSLSDVEIISPNSQDELIRTVENIHGKRDEDVRNGIYEGEWLPEKRIIIIPADARPSTVAHEVGHAVLDEYWANTDEATKKAIQAEHAAWAKKSYGKPTVADSLGSWQLWDQKRFPDLGAIRKKPKGKSAAAMKRVEDYRTSFLEWAADQFSYWSQTKEQPKSLVDKFFADLSSQLAKIWDAVKQHFAPNVTYANWIESLLKPTTAAENQTAASSAKEAAAAGVVQSETGKGSILPDDETKETPYKEESRVNFTGSNPQKAEQIIEYLDQLAKGGRATAYSAEEEKDVTVITPGATKAEIEKRLNEITKGDDALVKEIASQLGVKPTVKAIAEDIHNEAAKARNNLLQTYQEAIQGLPLEAGDKVSWFDEKDRQLYGVIKKITNGIATIARGEKAQEKGLLEVPVGILKLDTQDAVASRRKSLDSIIGKPQEVEMNAVSVGDGRESLAMVHNSGDVPGVLNAFVGTSKDFLANPENEKNFPGLYRLLKGGQVDEGNFAYGRAFVFTDGIGINAVDRANAVKLGVTPAVAAVRRVLIHESLVHRGIFGLPAHLQRKILQWVQQNTTPEQLDVLAKTYPRYADWRLNENQLLALCEEFLAKKVEKLTTISKSGPLARLMDILSDIWRWITGNTGEPTIKNLKDVVKLLKAGAEAADARLVNGGKIKMSQLRAQGFVTPEMDKAYMDAVNAGDMEEAQKMVDEAANNALAFSKARENGKLILLQHETPVAFTVFKPGGDDPSRSGPAIWLGVAGSSLKAGHRLGNRKNPNLKNMRLFADIKNPLLLDDEGMVDWAREVFLNGKSDWAKKEFPLLLPEDVVARIKAEGYDGIIFDTKEDRAEMQRQIDEHVKQMARLGNSTSTEMKPFDKAEIIAFDPNQIKSADPVTRDDAGNVIPLSQRFNAATPDIRASRPTYANPIDAQLANAAERLRAMREREAAPPVPKALARLFDTNAQQTGTANKLFQTAKAPESGRLGDIETMSPENIDWSLTQLDGRMRQDALGVSYEHYKNADVADQWYRYLANKVLSEDALMELNSMYAEMNPNAQFVERDLPRAAFKTGDISELTPEQTSWILLNADGEDRQRLLGVTRKHYSDAATADQWANYLAGKVANDPEAMAELSAMHQEMNPNAREEKATPLDNIKRIVNENVSRSEVESLLKDLNTEEIKEVARSIGYPTQGTKADNIRRILSFVGSRADAIAIRGINPINLNAPTIVRTPEQQAAFDEELRLAKEKAKELDISLPQKKPSHDQEAWNRNMAAIMAPSSVAPQKIRNEIRAAYDRAIVGESSIQVPLQKVFDEAKGAIPSLTERDFGKQLQNLYEDGSAFLVPTDRSADMIAAGEKWGVYDAAGMPASYVGLMPAQESPIIYATPIDRNAIQTQVEESAKAPVNEDSLKSFLLRAIAMHGQPSSVRMARLDPDAPLQVSAQPNGELVIGLGVRQAGEVIRNSRSTQAGFKYLADAVEEEMIHFADLLAMRSKWEAQGKQTDFDHFIRRQSMELTMDLMQTAETLSIADKEALRKVLAANLAAYSNNPNWNNDTLENVLQAYAESPMKMNAELVRSLIQAKRSGEITATGYQRIANTIVKWLQDALNWLKQSYNQARGGTFGNVLARRIQDVEGQLDALGASANIKASRIGDDVISRQKTDLQKQRITGEQVAYQGYPLTNSQGDPIAITRTQQAYKPRAELARQFVKEVADSLDDITQLPNEVINDSYLRAIGAEYMGDFQTLMLAEAENLLRERAKAETIPEEKQRLNQAVEQSAAFFRQGATQGGLDLNTIKQVQKDPRFAGMFALDTVKTQKKEDQAAVVEPNFNGGYAEGMGALNDEASTEAINDLEKELQDRLDQSWLEKAEATLPEKARLLLAKVRGWLADKAKLLQKIALARSALFLKQSKTKQSVAANAAANPFDSMTVAQVEAEIARMEKEVIKLDKKIGDALEFIGDELFDSGDVDSKTSGKQKAERMARTPRKETLLKPGKMTALQRLLDKTRDGWSWKQIFTMPKAGQERRRADMLKKVQENEAFKDLKDDEKAQLVELLDQAWIDRKATYLGQKLKADKTVRLPWVTNKGAAKKLESATPELLKAFNDGTFNKDTFNTILAKRYGVKPIDEKAMERAEQLAEELQDPDLPEPVYARKADELLKLIADTQQLNWAKMLNDAWVASVLAGPRTFFDIGFAALNGLQRVMVESTGLALHGDFKTPAQALSRFISILPQGLKEAAYFIKTGDVSILSNSKHQFARFLSKGLKGGGNHSSTSYQLANWDKDKASDATAAQKLQGKILRTIGRFMQIVERILTALDHINSTATKYAYLPLAIAQNKKKYADARLPNAQEMEQFRNQAKAYLLEGREPANFGEQTTLDAWTRHFSDKFYAHAQDIVEGASYAAGVSSGTVDPEGVVGAIYDNILAMASKATSAADELKLKAKALLKDPEVFRSDAYTKYALATLGQLAAYSARNLLGFRFIRFGANKLNDSLSYIPGIGLFRLAEKENDNATKSQMIWNNQAFGILLMMAGIYAIHAMEDEEDPEKRGFDLQGSWDGLSAEQKKQLSDSGKKEYTITFYRNGKPITLAYKTWPISAMLSAIGTMTDMVKFKREKWDQKQFTDRLVAATAIAATSTLDSAALSQFADLVGKSAYQADPDEAFVKRITRVGTNFAGGFVPRVFKDLDYWLLDDKARKYETVWENLGKEVPIYRQHIGGEKLNIFAEPIRTSRSPWSRAVIESPSDEAYRKLGLLNARDIWLTPASPEMRTIGTKNRRRHLTPEEQNRYIKLVGAGYKKIIEQYGDRAISMPKERAKAFIADKTRDVRDRAEKLATRPQ